MVDTASRMLRLLTVLQERPVWSGQVLAERLGVTTRTVRRDITRLRDLGYPIDATAGPEGGYRLGPGGDLPPLLLDDDEAAAVVVGLSTAVVAGVDGIDDASTRVLTKLDQVLPPRVRARVSELSTVTLDARGGPDAVTEVDAAKLLLIARHCARAEELRFRYTARDGAETRRRTEPYRLVRSGRRWYLVARDRDKAEWRTFRVDRMDRLVEYGERFVRAEEPDARELVRAAVGHGGYPCKGTVRVDVDLATVRDRLGPAWGRCEADGDATRIHVGAGSWHDLAVALGWLPWAPEVIGPPELRDAMLALAERYRAAAGPVTAGRAGSHGPRGE